MTEPTNDAPDPTVEVARSKAGDRGPSADDAFEAGLRVREMGYDV